jgi:hypothetical protein
MGWAFASYGVDLTLFFLEQQLNRLPHSGDAEPDEQEDEEKSLDVN